MSLWQTLEIALPTMVGAIAGVPLSLWVIKKFYGRYIVLLNISEREHLALSVMAAQKEMSKEKVLIQGLRVLQFNDVHYNLGHTQVWVDSNGVPIQSLAKMKTDEEEGVSNASL